VHRAECIKGNRKDDIFMPEPWDGWQWRQIRKYHMHLQHLALSGFTGIKARCFSLFTVNKKNNYLSLKEVLLPACQLRVSGKCISKFFFLIIVIIIAITIVNTYMVLTGGSALDYLLLFILWQITADFHSPYSDHVSDLNPRVNILLPEKLEEMERAFEIVLLTRLNFLFGSLIKKSTVLF